MRTSTRTIAEIACCTAAIVALGACAKPAAIGAAAPGTPYLVEVGPAGETATHELTVDFGATLVGSGLGRSVFVANDGPSSVVLTDATFADGASSSFRCVTSFPIVVKSGARAEVEFSFVPASAGDARATLRLLVANADVDALIVNMRGAGVPGTCAPAPEHLDFGETSVGRSYLRTLTIRNDSRLSLDITIPELEASSGFAFGQGFAAGAHIVPPAGESAGTLEIPIEFRPTHAGEFAATWRLPAPMPCAANIALHGTGVVHAVECDPSVHEFLLELCRVDFGLAHPGIKVVKPVRFRNLGTRDVTLTLVSVVPPLEAGPFGIEGTARTFVVPTGGAEVAIDLSFLTNTVGEQIGRLTLATDDPNRAAEYVELAGIGGGPAIEVGATTLDFGLAAVKIDQARQITIANVGDDVPGTTADNLLFAVKDGDSWTDKRAEINGPDAAEFSVEWPPANYPSEGIAVGDAAFLSVRFYPSTQGAKTATLIINSNDLQTPTVRVPLSADVVRLPPCTYEVQPPALDFGFVEPNRYLTRSIAITNHDPDPTHDCLVSSFAISPPTAQEGAFALVDGPLRSALIRGHETLLVPVRFLPRILGPFTGAVEFFISSPAQPKVTVALSGVAEEPCLIIAPRELDFGEAGVNCNSRQRIFTAFNTCSASVTITSVEMQPGLSSEFTVTRKPALPLTISAGASSDFGVTYRPTSIGADTAAVLVTISGNANPYVVPLSARGALDPMQTDIFTAPPAPKYDILFVIDNSSSMSDLQASLARNFAAFVHFLVQQRIDYHVAVTTTDVSSTGEAGRFVSLSAGSTRVITNTTPNKEQVFAAMTNVGTSGSETESLIRPAFLALSEPLLTGHNAGFYRTDAELAVFVISDASDQDPLATPASTYSDFFIGLKGLPRRNEFTFSGIVPVLPSEPSGCSYDTAGAGQDLRVKSVVQTTGGLLDEICNPDWSKTLEKFSPRVFDMWAAFPLSNVPDMTVADPITISVDGQPFPQFGTRGDKRWDYNSATNAIVFDPLAVHDLDWTISVTYRVACL